MTHTTVMIEFFNSLDDRYDKAYLNEGLERMKGHIKSGGKDNDKVGLKIFRAFFWEWQLMEANLNGVRADLSSMLRKTPEQYYQSAVRRLGGLERK